MDFAAWVGTGCLVGMFCLIVLGVPILFALAASAFVGLWLIGGSVTAFQQFATLPYYLTASYSFAVVPMFIFMGVLAGECGIAEKAYKAAYKWMGGLRGGILITTVGASAVFGACSGSALAGAAVFTKMAEPELKKYGYDYSLSLGCIAASGGLAALIPPSIPIVIICILTQLSIGKELVAGILPGIMVAVFLGLSIVVLGIFKPNSIPKGVGGVSLKEKFSSLTGLWPIACLFLLIIGGMYMGVFPPTVGGAIGSAGVILYGLATRVPIRKMVGALWETTLINAQLFPIIICGFLFARMIAISGLPNALMELIGRAGLPPLVVMLIVVVFYLFVGCVLEFVSMLVITLPVIFPLMTGLGYDPVALGIIVVLLGNIAGLTPPIGMTCFLVAGIAKVDSWVVFKGILPFFLVLMIALVLLVFFPQIASWLPHVFYG